MKRLLPLLFLLSVVGCAPMDDDGALADDPSADAAFADGKADAPAIAFTHLVDPALVPGNAAVHKVFTSQSAYIAFFGHRAPDVDFRGQWVVYYDAGQRANGGTVTIDGITKSQTGLTLKVAVSVTPSCDGQGAPAYALVRLNKQPGTTLSRFYTETAVCLADPPTSPACDVENRCPGVGMCISRTWDSCWPNRPGCVGVCSCTPSSTACPEGEHFDTSTAVCGCVPGIE